MNPGDEGYMQQHLCECFIDVAGEKLNVIWKGEPNLVPWPEIAVLLQMHGEQAVYDIKPVTLGPRESAAREKERLALKYGRDTVESVYAGRMPNIEWFMPGWPIDPAKQSKAKAKALMAARPPRVQFKQPDAEASDARI